MKKPKIVVLGGGYAGVLAALRASAQGAGRVRVELVSEGTELVERVRLHELAVRDVAIRHDLAELVRGTGIVVEKARVSAIDVAKRTLRTDEGDKSYDALVVAAGSQSGVPPIPGISEHAFFLEPKGAVALRRRLDGLEERGDVVVVGGGLTGIEAAAEIAEAHPAMRVTLVTSGEVGEMLAPRARDAVLEGLAKLGVAVLESQRVLAIGASSVQTSEATLPADVCVWTGGFRASPLLAEAGLSVNALGQCRIGPTLAALGHDDVWVAGDAGAPVVAPGSPIHPGCKTAMPMGAHAGGNAVRSLLGEEPVPFDFRDTGYCVSLGRRKGVIDARIQGWVITGRAGAFIKEAICRFTVASLRWERSGLRRYGWLHTGKAPALLPEVELAASTVLETR